MVLVRAALALLLTGCIKAGAPVVAPSSVDVASAISLGTIDIAHGHALPEGLEGTVREVLATRRLNLRPLQAPQDFKTRQSTAHRLNWLASQNGGAAMLLLIELQAERYDNMGGRFRWVVDVKLSLAAQADPAQAQVTEFSVPVHLGHAHDDATAAVAASLPMLRRRLAAALDSHLAGASAP